MIRTWGGPPAPPPWTTSRVLGTLALFGLAAWLIYGVGQEKGFYREPRW